MNIIPLQWLCDKATRELEKRAPAANMNYIFDNDNAKQGQVTPLTAWIVEKVKPDQWAKSTAQQTVQIRIINAISKGQVTPLNAFGAKALNLPDNPTRLIHELKVSRQDAVNILDSCGLGAELLNELRQTPEEILEEGRKHGLSDKEIAAQIDAVWFGYDRLTHEQLAILFRGKPHGKGADKKHGSRLREEDS